MSPYNNWDFATDRPGPWFDCENPVNDSPVNTGLVNLPPAKPAQIYYTYSPSSYFPELYGGGAMAGPMYRYDADQPVHRRSSPSGSTGAASSSTGRRTGSKLRASKTARPRRHARASSRAFEFSKPMDMDVRARRRRCTCSSTATGWGSSNDDSGIYRIDYVEGNRRPVVRQNASANSGALPLTVQFDASAVDRSRRRRAHLCVGLRRRRHHRRHGRDGLAHLHDGGQRSRPASP